ncbi:hypothetical protein ACFYZ9_03260 [Streptomyces sp. NPDC001691]|uniref:hypothetical protein n=1 Tax=unclassified Streptomyces TaxID=2593676 RepID=UPI000DE93CC7|nr:hypothetical protein [Streptomyces sp. SDr-06]RCH64580.1 hypothetical protein DT019_32305 [Streptomyces sp. SDr-06]
MGDIKSTEPIIKPLDVHATAVGDDGTVKPLDVHATAAADDGTVGPLDVHATATDASTNDVHATSEPVT